MNLNDHRRLVNALARGDKPTDAQRINDRLMDEAVMQALYAKEKGVEFPESLREVIPAHMVRENQKMGFYD